MKRIITPVDREVLSSELTEKCFLRDTNRAGNKIYIVDYESAPNVVREVGRLREIAFREGGGGTGMSLDLDKFDTDPAFGYKQLVVWDPEAEAIVGGYRYALCRDALFTYDGQPVLTSSHMFQFSRKFLRRDFLETLELGRSFVSVDYQSTKIGAKSLYALDNLFDGLGAIMRLYNKRYGIRYMFGKMTIYPEYPEEARNMILYFLNKHFGARGESLIIPRNPVKLHYSPKYRLLFHHSSFEEDYKILKAEVHKYGVNIPPLVNSYMNLSPSMKIFGTGINDEFADVYDTGLLIDFEDLRPEKASRHVKFKDNKTFTSILRRFRK